MSETSPRIALGGMHFGTRVPTTLAHDILDAYVDLGGEWIDTANCYAFWGDDSGHGGQSESVIGEWLTRHGDRDHIKLSTKVGAEPLRPGSFPDAVEGLSGPVVRNSIQDSLRRLNVDHVDLYWAHMEDRTQPVSDVVDTFGGLVADGLTRHIGLSNHPAWYLAAANTHAEHQGGTRFSAAQLRESYLHPRPDILVDGQDHPNGMMTPETKDLASRFELSLWAYTPLMTGAYEHLDRVLPAAYDHPGNSARLTALRAWARELQVKPSQVVIAWLLAQHPSITPIVGVSSTLQLTQAIKATTLTLPDEAQAELNTAGG